MRSPGASKRRLISDETSRLRLAGQPRAFGHFDYSEELLPHLGMYADITLYVEDGLRPVNPRLAQHFEIRPVSRLERDHRRRPFDAIIYHMGNSAAHLGIWRALQRTPAL